MPQEGRKYTEPQFEQATKTKCRYVQGAALFIAPRTEPTAHPLQLAPKSPSVRCSAGWEIFKYPTSSTTAWPKSIPILMPSSGNAAMARSFPDRFPSSRPAMPGSRKGERSYPSWPCGFVRATSTMARQPTGAMIDERFNLGFTAKVGSDLIAFLNSFLALTLVLAFGCASGFLAITRPTIRNAIC